MCGKMEVKTFYVWKDGNKKHFMCGKMEIKDILCGKMEIKNILCVER